MSHWTQSPAAIDQLAAAYVAGTLQGRARRRLETAMQEQPAIVDALNDWTTRLTPLYTALPPHSVSADLWSRIAAANGLQVSGAAAVGTSVASPTASWWRRLFTPIPAATLAMGLVVGMAVPVMWQLHLESQKRMELPASYVGVLATAKGEPGLIISSLRRGTVVDIKQVTPAVVPDGRTLYLWRIDKDGKIDPLAPLPNGNFTHLTLNEPAETVFVSAVELAVSLEPVGITPTEPTQPFVYRGLCGKLWR